MISNKVFYTAFHKCATTSMGYFFKDVGYVVCDHGAFQPSNRQEIKKICAGDYSSLVDASQNYDAFFDSPWFLFYKIFDNLYDAKFVHCIRDPESWYKSCVRYFKDQPASPIDKFIYGNEVAFSVENNKNFWIERYLRHNQEVLDYFKGRSNFLLVDLFDKNNKTEEQICNFVGVDRGGATISKTNQTVETVPPIITKEDPVEQYPVQQENSSKLKFAIVQLGDSAYMKNAKPFCDTVSSYCAKHGYHYFPHTEPIDDCDLTYQKPKAILKYIDRYDYVMWLDGDCMVFNEDISLESIVKEFPNKSLFACKDPGFWALNAGALIFKNSPEAKDILNKWWDIRDKENHGSKWRSGGLTRQGHCQDQSTLIALLGLEGHGCDANLVKEKIDPEHYHIFKIQEDKFNTPTTTR